ncbi:glycine C-acetyltransferase [Kibdelosporangium banguiense]|uniref:8-amino-7-oxononanoate synthase n=1 Tax=Kibdelosporangium banguiense TaxID=1365924 RepID=A0ABS4TIR3_9PSEU|nr:aminotransferase class I/II-fold pyridoxal phosphate-dependent enzyme [Kibdelosporangium banguiense]MBP2324316.1 glycine C-acetyltransferase [Kibdelosporangium banguiense]
MSTSEAWKYLEPKIANIQERIFELEWEPSRRNNFVPYKADGNTAYVFVEGQRLLMMSGYGYIGLNGDPRVVAAAKAAVDEYGTGTPGVRALAGTIPLHEELEREVAKFLGRESALVFSSGYAGNVGVIGALVGAGDTIFLDKLDHASIVDGAQLTGATLTRFRHNDPGHLDRRLEATAPGGTRLVIVDSVYSMDGDIAPLPALREVCDKHNALLMVDEAHALGVIGATGRGIEEHFNYEVKADIKVGTLSKAIPANGGWIVGEKILMDYVKRFARPFLFSAALAPAQVGAALESLRILDREPERVSYTQREAARFRDLVQQAGFNTGDTETAVVPLIVGSNDKAWDFASALQKGGVVGLPVISPAVQPHMARLRIAITAAHSRADIDYAIDSFITAARQTKVLEG